MKKGVFKSRNLTCSIIFLVLVPVLFSVTPTPISGETDIENIKSKFKSSPEAVLDQLSEKSLEVRIALIPQLKDALRSDSWGVSMKSMEQMISIGRESPGDVIPVLLDVLETARQNENRSLRLQVIRALGKIGKGTDQVLPVLLQAMNSKSSSVQQEAIHAIGHFGQKAKEAVPKLVSMTHSNQAIQRWFAWEALQSCVPEENLVEVLSSVLKSQDPGLRREAIKLLLNTDQDLSPAKEQIFTLVRESLPSRPRMDLMKLLRRFDSDASDFVPDIVRAGRKAKPEHQNIMQNTINEIKDRNKPPVSSEKSVSCREGESTVVQLEAEDPDDLSIGLKAIISSDPEHGTLEREGRMRFRYSSTPGFTGQDSFQWHVTDGNQKSEPATVTVQIKPDTTPPAVQRVLAHGQENTRVRIMLNEPVLPASATNGNFTISGGVTLNSVQFSKRDESQLLLTTSPMEEGHSYTMTIHPLTDRSEARNTMEETVRIKFTYRKFSPRKLLLYAPGNGNAKDLSENNYHGTVKEGARVDDGAGRSGAFAFDGIDGNEKNAVSFGVIDSFNSAGTFTVAFWFRRTEDGGGSTNHETSNVMFSQGSDNSNDNIEIGTKGNAVQVFLDTSGSDQIKQWNGGIENDRWYHLTLTFDAEREKEAKLFINGDLKTSWSSWDGSLADAPSPTTIGNTFHIETPFAGLIDELFLYNRVLKPGEVNGLAGNRPK